MPTRKTGRVVRKGRNARTESAFRSEVLLRAAKIRWIAWGYTAPEKPISRMVLAQVACVVASGRKPFAGWFSRTQAVASPMPSPENMVAASRPKSPIASRIPCRQSVHATARSPPRSS